jgi:hypothetical protein
MESIIGLFLFGTVEFWLFWAVASIFIICSLEMKKFLWGNMFALIGGALIYMSFTRLAPGSITLENVATYVGLYLLAGGFWSLFKWWRHCREAVEYANGELDHYPTNYDGIKSNLSNALMASHNKGMICAWIAYWPWSLLWNVSRDMVNTVFDCLTGLYNNISNNAMGQLKKPDPPKKEGQ